MTRKEEIIYAALELAAEHGLKAVSLSQIADKVGIKKPSLYNHFSSKEELMDEMYVFLREKAHKLPVITAAELGKMITDNSLENILLFFLKGYLGFLGDKDMLCFFKVLYSERCNSPEAARIVLEETEHMVNGVKSLFYALVVHGKMKNHMVDEAALSYALTIHSLIDKQMDKMTTEGTDVSTQITEEMVGYIKWFCKVTEA